MKHRDSDKTIPLATAISRFFPHLNRTAIHQWQYKNVFWPHTYAMGRYGSWLDIYDVVTIAVMLLLFRLGVSKTEMQWDKIVFGDPSWPNEDELKARAGGRPIQEFLKRTNFQAIAYCQHYDTKSYGADASEQRCRVYFVPFKLLGEFFHEHKSQLPAGHGLVNCAVWHNALAKRFSEA